MDIQKLHEKFMSGEKISVIAYQFDVSEGYVQQQISKQRKLNPDKWPSRNKSLTKHLFHVYECEDCVLTFAVEQAFEDQSDVLCPVCSSGENLRDVVSGEMEIK